MKKITTNQIIIVDDEPEYTYLVQEALKGCNPCPTVKVVHSGAALLEWLEISGRPSVIFLDIHMPGSTGFDVLKVLKSAEKYKAIPVVMLTVSAYRDDVVKSYQHGANAFITKPISFSELVRRMELFSHFWFTISQTLDSSWDISEGFSRD